MNGLQNGRYSAFLISKLNFAVIFELDAIANGHSMISDSISSFCRTFGMDLSFDFLLITAITLISRIQHNITAYHD